jgi:hypothetical protein
MVGYGRLEGVPATTVLGELHAVVRLYVNFFQPSFKLKSKIRVGAKVSKKYYTPATPYERLLANDRVTTECKEQLRHTFSILDPVQLLNQIRQAQRKLVQEVGGESEKITETSQELSRFVKSLSTVWHDGEIRPTHRKLSTEPRTWRTRADPFENVWPVAERWLNEHPDANAKELFHRLQTELSVSFDPGQLRTLQRRVKEWRTAITRRLVLSSGVEAGKPATVAGTNGRQL